MASITRLQKTSLLVGIVAATVTTAAAIWKFRSDPSVMTVPVAAESATGSRVAGVVFELNDGSYTKPTDGKGVSSIDAKFVGTEATALWAIDFRKIGPVVFSPVKGGSLVKVVLAEVPAENN